MSKAKAVKDSGDALEDDFILEDDQYLSDVSEDGHELAGASDNEELGQAQAGDKRKQAPLKETDKKKKKKKLSKKDKEQEKIPLGKRVHEKQIMAIKESQDWAFKNLSSMELDERRIPSEAIKDSKAFALDHTLVHLESFLKFSVEGWKTKIFVQDASANQKGPVADQANTPSAKKAKKKPLEKVEGLPKGSPVALILSPSGIRCMDVIRALPAFQEVAKVGKLFAKHLKVPEQAHFLENTVTHICSGTPNRVEKLIQDDALKLDRLELIVLDCFKDAKQRTILDMQEIRVDLFNLLNSQPIMDRLKAGKTKVILF
ncbi:hypothetical protein DFQ27_001499 [Actinomortierella ambigua]|uniref:U3-containing 90S pre-ribosomal complex subunit-domain containing protein n=1 Tax=Actinomortierella ambigua TaxID=1343610 RepID=A0A9P6QA48_9FUNG|nr:hypothetical protein DFQ26_006813 [Actinomortierella ambigua]KAG0264024.1 hypothetical protein DFQ27_001499 [Actinomortierella ambigua]